jgi:TetR/AcrR family transcriptional repressor of lmrAB and yxaGH operons
MPETRPRDTRRRMVVATSKLLQKQGFHGTGLNQILSEAEAPKGSMYFHFPGGKNQLAAEAIAASGDYLERVLNARQGASGLESVDAYLVEVADWLERTEFREGCPIATTALEVGATTPEIGDACDAAFEQLIGRLAEWLEADGFDAATAHDRATLTYAAIEGALTFAKAKRSRQPLDQLRSQLPRLVGMPNS